MKFGLALGSNLGDRRENMTRARALLLEDAADPGSALCSGLYETSPVDCEPGTEPFYNAVLEIDLAFSPGEILALAQRIEGKLGREARRARHASRPIDIDILYAESATVSTPELEIPHPRLPERRFVLEPLHDIRPKLMLPGQDRPVMEILKQLESDEPPLILVARDW